MHFSNTWLLSRVNKIFPNWCFLLHQPHRRKQLLTVLVLIVLIGCSKLYQTKPIIQKPGELMFLLYTSFAQGQPKKIPIRVESLLRDEPVSPAPRRFSHDQRSGGLCAHTPQGLEVRSSAEQASQWILPHLFSPLSWKKSCMIFLEGKKKKDSPLLSSWSFGNRITAVCNEASPYASWVRGRFCRGFVLSPAWASLQLGPPQTNAEVYQQESPAETYHTWRLPHKMKASLSHSEAQCHSSMWLSQVSVYPEPYGRHGLGWVKSKAEV